MSPTEALRNAERLLRERGWSRCAAESAAGRLCLRHAVMLGSEGDDDAALGACLLLYEAGCRGHHMTDSGPRAGIEGWNDSLDDLSGRAHVDAAIRRAIQAGRTGPNRQRER